MKINIKLFGGRGARSGSTKKSEGIRTSKKVTKKNKTTGGSSLNFSNRKNLVNSINEQISVDLNKAATGRQFAPRTGLNIDSRKLSKNEFSTLRSFTKRKNIKMESNGVNDYFIRFKK